MAAKATITEIAIDTRDPMPGELVVEREAITYRSATATRPRMGWVETDGAGHVHAYDDQGDLPTLIGRTVHADCDGVHLGPMLDPEQPCEGYDITEWHCRICDQEIKPQREPDTGTKTMPGMTTWHVMVSPAEEITGKVTVWVHVGELWYFGVAEARTEGIKFGPGDAPKITTRLCGIGPLGRRAR